MPQKKIMDKIFVATSPRQTLAMPDYLIQESIERQAKIIGEGLRDMAADKIMEAVVGDYVREDGYLQERIGSQFPWNDEIRYTVRIEIKAEH